MKILHCKYCGKKVAEIENGSKIRNGTVLICRECQQERASNQTVNTLQELLGIK